MVLRIVVLDRVGRYGGYQYFKLLINLAILQVPKAMSTDDDDDDDLEPLFHPSLFPKASVQDCFG